MDADERVRYSVAADPSAPAPLLEMLARSQPKDVRAYVAGNRSVAWCGIGGVGQVQVQGLLVR